MAVERPISARWNEHDLGSTGWNILHQLARQRGRKPKDQALHLVRYALYQKSRGADVELSQLKLETLLNSDLTEVAS